MNEPVSQLPQFYITILRNTSYSWVIAPNYVAATASFWLALRHHADDDTHGLLVDCQPPPPRFAIITLGNVVDDAREPITHTYAHTHVRSHIWVAIRCHFICMCS